MRFRIGCLLAVVFAVSNGLHSCCGSEFIPLNNPSDIDFWSGATAISFDGSVVTGEGLQLPAGSAFANAFIWTDFYGRVDLQGASEIMPMSTKARGVTSNSNVVGTIFDGLNAPMAYRWTQNEGFVNLGFLSDDGAAASYGEGISRDGTIIVGSSTSTNGDSEAFYWTEQQGMQGLGDLPGGDFNSRAIGISNDGASVVGQATSEIGQQAFYWTATTGIVGMGDLEGGEFYGYATDISNNGDVIVGSSSSTQSGTRLEAFRWTEQNSFESLGSLVGNSFYSYAEAISGDGTVVVGTSVGPADTAYDCAFVWDTSHGMRNLQEVLAGHFGLETALTGWQLITATDISSDGLSIVGRGINPEGQFEAWLAQLDHQFGLPEPPTFLLTLFSFALASRWRYWSNNYVSHLKSGNT